MFSLSSFGHSATGPTPGLSLQLPTLFGTIGRGEAGAWGCLGMRVADVSTVTRWSYKAVGLVLAALGSASPPELRTLVSGPFAALVAARRGFPLEGIDGFS